MLRLERTDSTTLTNIYYNKNQVGTKLTPLGRIRRIKRLDKEFSIYFYKYKIQK